MADDKPKNADFIGSVVSDAKNPPETRMLTGWFGDSGEKGYRRLYADAELSNYADIPDDAILYNEPLRDAQPSGCVLVWIKRDAAVKQGGSASSRAARFLQGQVQQDFAAGAAGSLEKAGLRCVTEVPCGEPTGFTGQCTKQPDVGGAWPCVTEIPHCFEVTGFTGKCTHAPWPNPTRYIGCTYLHCPTNDLTHIPYICNVVASGMPGCAVVNPPQGGDPAQKAGVAEADEKAVPATSIPGCGYTRTWGVCETHLLGCGDTKDCPAAFEQGGAAAHPASVICATAIGCDITVFCPTSNLQFCHPTRLQHQCFPIPSQFCPVTQACPFGPGGGGDPAQRFAAFDAAAQIVPNTQAPGCFVSGVIICQTPGCTVPVTSPDFKCTQSGPACPTKPLTVCTQTIQTQCTQSGPQCPTSCGPECQSQQVNCTQVGTICGHKPCTPNPEVCPSLGIFACTAVAPCKTDTNVLLDCTFGCTQAGTGCPITTPQVICANPADAQAFAARALPLTQVGCPPSDFVACSQFGGCPTLPKGDCTFFGCPTQPQYAAAGPGYGCTQSGPQCPTHAKPQCTFFGPGCPPTPATICTQFAPCPTHQQPCHTPGFECTMFCTHGAPGCPQTIPNAACVGPITVGGPQCPVHSGFNCPSAIGCQSIACQSAACQPGGGQEQQAFARQAGGAVQTLATLCTQIAAQCPTYPNGDCTFFGCPHTQSGPGCPPTPATICTQFAPCPTYPRGDCTFFGCQHTHSGPACPPTPATVCTQFAPCPTHHIPCVSPGIDCTVMFCTHAGPGCPPTPATICTQFAPCPTLLTQPILQCNPSAVDACPTRPCTQIIQCNPSAIDACPTRLGCPTQNPQQCPPASGFNCPSQVCQSIACQPEGGQQEFRAAHPTIWTQLGPQCAPTTACRENTYYPCTRDCPLQGITIPSWQCNWWQ